MKVFVTGANGYIGKALVKVGCSPLNCNVLDYDSVDKGIEESKPEIVIHLAGQSSVDKCETDADKSYSLNIKGVYTVMENCAKREIPAVFLSSSQIWGGGRWESVWNRHAEDSKLTPAVNRYGMQKVAAESIALTWKSCKVIRTSFVFSKERLTNELEWLKHGVPVDAPKFMRRSFIHLDDFVYLLSEYCRRFNEMPNILHLAGSKEVSYYDFWLEVCKQFGYDSKLVRGRRKENNLMYSAKRPHRAGLDISLSQKLGFKPFDYIGGIARMKNEG